MRLRTFDFELKQVKYLSDKPFLYFPMQGSVILVLAGVIAAQRGRDLGKRLKAARTIDERLAIIGNFKHGRVNPNGGKFYVLYCHRLLSLNSMILFTSGAYIPENLTAQFYQKTSRFTENWQKPSCVRTKKWSETYEGAELAQNRGQIWTQHA